MARYQRVRTFLSTGDITSLLLHFSSILIQMVQQDLSSDQASLVTFKYICMKTIGTKKFKSLISIKPYIIYIIYDKTIWLKHYLWKFLGLVVSAQKTVYKTVRTHALAEK